jgi:hypothetical protein
MGHPCADCACHCHSPDEDIPPGHLETCAWADPDYMPGDFIPGDAPMEDVPAIANCECPPDIQNRHFLDCMLRRDRERVARTELENTRLLKRARKAEKKLKKAKQVLAELRAQRAKKAAQP